MISYQSLPSIATAMNDTYNTILTINTMLAMYFPMYIVHTVNLSAPLDIKNSITSELQFCVA